MAEMTERERFAIAQELAARLLYRDISRREFLRRAAVAGLSTATISSILAACGGDDDDDDDEGSDPTEADTEPTATEQATARPVVPSTPTPTETSGSGGGDDPTATEAQEEPTATEEPDDEEESAGGTLHIGMAGEPPGLDPGALCNVNCHTVAMHMYDSLLAMDTSFNVHPWLATSWELSEDMLGYIFTLRDDVTFHDGTPLNAEAVKFSLDRIAMPETGATSAIAIIGPNYEVTDVIDEYTVEVRFTAPYAPFLGGITTAFLGIVSPTSAQEFGADFAQNPVGTGPFIFEEWVAQQSTSMTVNPDYNWAPAIFSHQGRARLDRIEYQYVPESATRQALLDTGEAQFIDAVPPQSVAAIESNDDQQMIVASRPGASKMIDLNTSKAPLDELEVRQALHHAFDRDTLVDTVLFGAFEPSSTPLARSTFGFDESVAGMYPYDPDLAAEMLDAAGWVLDGDVRKRDGEEFRLNCIIGTSEEDAGIAQVLQQQWGEIGVAMEINVIAGTAQTEAKRNGDHHIGFKIGVYQDPDILGIYFHPRSIGGFNYTFFDDPVLADLFDKGIATLDPAERAEVYSEISVYMMDQAIMIPIYYLSNLSAASADLTGLVHDTAGYWWFYDASFEES